MNKDQHVGRPRRTVNFCAEFSSINKAFAIVPKYLADNVMFVIIPLSLGSATLSTNQRTACLALAGTLSGVAVPQRRSTARRVRLNTAQSGSRPVLAVETRSVPHLCELNRPAPSGGNAP